MEKIAVFDFDETIINTDSLYAFLIFNYGPFKFLSGVALLSPVFISYKLGLITNSRAKEILLSFFFRNTTLDYFNEKCRKFHARMQKRLNKKILEKINFHVEKKNRVIIATASIENWVQPFADSLGIKEVIATKLEFKDNKFTGRLDGKNCYGKEKLRRLRQHLGGFQGKHIILYTDGKGDKPLMKEFSEVYLAQRKNLIKLR